MPIVKGFRRFRSDILSFRQVVSEVSGLVPGSNVQKSRWSSDAPSTCKRKRITSADRRVLLEAFVNKYRAMNSGKFPTPTSAVKEVGGGYYYIKKILQEMEYNSKISSMEKVPLKETKNQTKAEEEEEEEDIVSRKIAIESYKSQKVSNSQIAMDQNLYEDAWLEASANLHTNPQVKEKEGIPPSTHNNITKDSEIKAEQQDDGRIKNIIRDMPESQKDVVLREKPSSSSSSSSSSSIWGNLKLLASGFINIWKKQ